MGAESSQGNDGRFVDFDAEYTAEEIEQIATMAAEGGWPEWRDLPDDPLWPHGPGTRPATSGPVAFEVPVRFVELFGAPTTGKTHLLVDEPETND